RLADEDEPPGVAVGERRQEDPVDEREEGDRRADPQGEGRHGDGGEDAGAPEAAQSVAQVPPQVPEGPGERRRSERAARRHGNPPFGCHYAGQRPNVLVAWGPKGNPSWCRSPSS